MEIDELREYAKSLGIKQTHNMKKETINKKIEALNQPEDSKPKESRFVVNTMEDKAGYLKSHRFNFESIRRYAKELGADSMIYRKNKRAFECFKQKKSIEFLSLGMF